MHRTTTRFWKCYEELPDPVRELARKNFEILKKDPRYPSLHFKRIGKFWSARIGLDYRALAVMDGEDMIWVWIGAHDDYDRLIADKT